MSNHSMWWILNSIFVVVFDTVFFLLVNTVTDIQWVSLAFLHISYFIVVFFGTYLKNKMTNIVLGYPIIYLSILYFLLTFILSLAIVTFEFTSIKITFILHFIILGVYLFLLFSNLMMNKHTAQQTAVERKSIGFIKENIAGLEQLKAAPIAASKKNRIEEIIELLRYGQVVSHNDTFDLEYSIRQHINDLISVTSDEELSHKLQKLEELIQRREIIIKSAVTN
ncbi:hypothetical protein [Lederbergia citrea]|uniref:Uncharacterized protein n=1 Tax=Lederbergia citrea TaxID=2833581 RepID=A0A942UKK2_9BACI|nr:hypothetical protein [Lederbergia citrea]MBS4178293.1 hypothetical protein [Lederbergia citrea]MBS4223176.1 hypothetical protein [Lederbergia citrea]